jgi:ABC-type glycerol-3-phosphate transport system permease component
MHKSARETRGTARVGHYSEQILLHAIAIVIFVIMVVPFVWMLLTAIRETYTPLDVFQHPIPRKVTLANFQKVMAANQMGRAFLNSVVISIFIVSLNVAFAAMAGYAFAKKEFVGKNVLFSIVLLVMMIPFHVTLVPLFTMLGKLKWIDTFQGIIMPQAVSCFGIFMMTQFMRGIPQELLDSAAIDGANEIDIFARIVLPLCGPALSALSILSFLASWNMFLWPLIIATSADMRTIQVGLALFTDRYGTSNWGLTMAGSTVALLPMLITYIFLQRRFVQGIAMSGLKF